VSGIGASWRFGLDDGAANDPDLAAKDPGRFDDQFSEREASTTSGDRGDRGRDPVNELEGLA
jgi:hypothetical protein